MKKIILASASPRRKELLKQVGVKFKIYIANIEEEINEELKPNQTVVDLSLQKAKYVANVKIDDDALIIGADTIVVQKDTILGKPKDKQHAYEMLKKLSGKWHDVYTGITIISVPENKILSEYCKTSVKFANIDDETIMNYINTGEPFDKAGSYAIQGIGAVLVEEIKGSYTNVVGFPLFILSKMLQKFNIKIL